MWLVGEIGAVRRTPQSIQCGQDAITVEPVTFMSVNRFNV